MFIVRWLLSHPLLLAWALAILTILLNFGSGSKEHVEHEEKAPATTEVQDEKASATADAQEVPVAQAVPVTGEATVPTETTDTAPVVEAEPANTEVAAPVVEAEPVATETLTDPNTVVAPVQAPAAVSTENLLMMARNAYWQGDLQNSVQYYDQLIKQAPAEISYKGELANVLWKNNQPKEAAAIYAEIAMPMIQAGKRQEVMNLIGFIGLYFPEKAQAISAEINK